MAVKAIIFDVDGTLSETEEAHREAFNATFKEFGLPWVWSQELYGELLKTTGGKERMTEYLANHLNQPADQAKIAEIHKRKTAIYGELIASGAAALRPGIAALMEDAVKHGVRVAVATTTNRPNVDRLAEACFGKAASDVFEVIAAGDEVENKKPAS
ncbi:MAG: HAD family hydrolase, partial [Alphaproteobacteria bacterium]